MCIRRSTLMYPPKYYGVCLYAVSAEVLTMYPPTEVHCCSIPHSASIMHQSSSPGPSGFDFSVSGCPPAPLEGLGPDPSKQKHHTPLRARAAEPGPRAPCCPRNKTPRPPPAVTTAAVVSGEGTVYLRSGYIRRAWTLVCRGR